MELLEKAEREELRRGEGIRREVESLRERFSLEVIEAKKEAMAMAEKEASALREARDAALSEAKRLTETLDRLRDSTNEEIRDLKVKERENNTVLRRHTRSSRKEGRVGKTHTERERE